MELCGKCAVQTMRARNDINTLLCKQRTKVAKCCFARQALTTQIEQSTHKFA